MQRQAVPCLRAEKALVGTGIERTVALILERLFKQREGVLLIMLIQEEL